MGTVPNDIWRLIGRIEVIADSALYNDAEARRRIRDVIEAFDRRFGQGENTEWQGPEQ